MSILQFSRKRCRVLIIWIMLFASVQILIYTMLFADLESSPRKGLSNKLKMVKLHSALVDELERETVRESLKNNIPKKIETKSVVDIHDGTQSKIFISRKLEKFKGLKEAKQKVSSIFTSITHITKKIERKLGENNSIIFKPSNDASEFAANIERPTGPDDIFVSVKTTRQYHSTRLDEIRKTWWTLAKRETFFFSDAHDAAANEVFDGHVINTNCTSGHQRSALCCKMQYELNFFWKKSENKRWFCHFDDDNYVIFPSLIKLLQQYNHSEPVYLGRPSLQRKMQTWDKQEDNQEVKFWFATGGAGFCLSQKLVSMMKPYFSGQAFGKTCERIGLPDDCTVGFISEHLLGVQLTKINSFHSHLEWLEGIPEHELREQVSLSHGYLGRQYNHIKIQGPFNEQQDPSRFKSLHCNLYPQTAWCK